MSSKGFGTLELIAGIVFGIAVSVGGLYLFKLNWTRPFSNEAAETIKNSTAVAPINSTSTGITSTEQKVSTSSIGGSATTFHYGIANCSSLATSTSVFNDPIVTSSYSLFVATDTSSTLEAGISFCYPSYLKVSYVSGWAWPPVGVTWPSGVGMQIASPQGPNRSATPVQNVLGWCAAGASDGCTPPHDFQMIHGVNESGLDYYLFWSDYESDKGIFASDTGPFAYVATPNNPTLVDPFRIGEETFTPSMLRDLIVILNTLTISKPL